MRNRRLLYTLTVFALGCADSVEGIDEPEDATLDMRPEDAGDAAFEDAEDATPEDAGRVDAQPERGDRPRFAFPIDPTDRELMNATLMFGFDHGPGDRRTICTAYDGDGFPACYGGHHGSDFVLVGGFRQMDERSAQVVAAAGGEVIEVADGHYDRCRADLATQEVTCDGHEMRANQVTIRHPGGWVSRYFHLKRDTVAVAVGDQVDCEHFLGFVGSSGYSSMPHLHFEVVDPSGASVDPFAVDPEDGLWREQLEDEMRPANGCDPAWGPAQ